MRTGQRVSGTYTNGISTWNFSGLVSGTSCDTAGGNFGTATITLDTPFKDAWGDARERLLATLDGAGNLADSRYNLDS